MWSTGCIFAELTTGSPLMPGAAEREQLELMVSLLGTPSTRIWPGIMDCAPECVTALKAMKSQPYNNLHSKTPSLTGAGYEFLNAMLTYDPEQRITAAEALVHQYFSEPPAPADKAMMPTFSEVYKKG